MPVANYGLLRGTVINSLPYVKTADHYNIEVSAANVLYRIAVDVYSAAKGTKVKFSAQGLSALDTDRLVMFYKDENYSHPLLTSLVTAPVGMTSGGALDQALHLDYLRYDPVLFPIADMTVVPPKDENGNGVDLNDDIDPWVQKALNNPNAEIFAWGSGWDDNTSGTRDTRGYFNPDPTLGIHDIHMNQGDATSGSEGKYNGIWQDGALFFRFTENGGETWVAMFFRFQNQSIQTDNNGNPA